MRYFLVAFTVPNGNGNSFFAWDGFPANKEIQKSVSDGQPFPPEKVAVVNIFEFKSKEDYEAFRK